MRRRFRPTSGPVKSCEYAKFSHKTPTFTKQVPNQRVATDSSRAASMDHGTERLVRRSRCDDPCPAKRNARKCPEMSGLSRPSAKNRKRSHRGNSRHKYRQKNELRRSRAAVVADFAE